MKSPATIRSPRYEPRALTGLSKPAPIGLQAEPSQRAMFEAFTSTTRKLSGRNSMRSKVPATTTVALSAYRAPPSIPAPKPAEHREREAIPPAPVLARLRLRAQEPEVGHARVRCFAPAALGQRTCQSRKRHSAKNDCAQREADREVRGLTRLEAA